MKRATASPVQLGQAICPTPFNSALLQAAVPTQRPARVVDCHLCNTLTIRIWPKTQALLR